MIDPVPHYPMPFLHGGDYVDVLVSLSEIAPSPTNPRRDFPADYIYELAKSIEAQGVLQPILLRPWPDHYGPAPREERQEWKLRPAPRYEIVSGECRYRAALQAGLEEIPAHVRVMSDSRVLAVQLIENIQRKQLNALDEAAGFRRLIDVAGIRAEDIPQHLGKGWSRSYVYGRLKLLDACPEVRRALLDGVIPVATALDLARLPTGVLQAKALAEIIKPSHRGEIMSVRAAQAFLRDRYMLTMSAAPFGIEDETLLPHAGACATCAKRSINAPDDFPAASGADVCTDPDCFAEKRRALADRQVAEAAEVGKKVIAGEEAERIVYASGNLKTHGEYTLTSERSWADAERRTIAEIAEEKGIELPTVLLQAPYAPGGLVEAVPTRALAAALEAAGIEPTTQFQPALTEEEKAAQKAKAEEKYRQLEEEASQERARRWDIFENNHYRLRELGPLVSERIRFALQLLAERALAGVESAVVRAEVCRAWGVVDADGDADIHALPAHIKALPAGDLLTLAIDLTTAGECQVAPHNFRDKPARGLEFVDEHFRAEREAHARSAGDSAGPGVEDEVEADGAADPLYDEAVRVVRETGQASAGILQRRLHVRRERCVALLHALEANGVVSAPGTNGKREVLK